MASMRAMELHSAKTSLRLIERRPPEPHDGQVLVRVRACGVCRTDLHIVDGELSAPSYPVVPGHEIVGIVERCGPGATRFQVGDRVGVPWLGWTCGECAFCRAGQENLCDRARFTGLDIDGGYADFCVADERYCFAIPEGYQDVEAAPLMCAGLIGYRALRLAGDVERVGVYGFGAAAHIVTQVMKHRGQQVYAFTKHGDADGQVFARSLGAAWAGASDELAPDELDAAVLFAPVGTLVPLALRAVRKGGTVVCAGIHMSNIPSFPYSLLWGERVLRSVANLTRRDAEEFLALAPKVRVETTVERYPLARANEALDALREGRVRGAAVLVP
jgi:alcohol dehydrogenase, propanol-preferring